MKRRAVLCILAACFLLWAPIAAHAWGSAHQWIRAWAVRRLPMEIAKRVDSESLARLHTAYTSLQDMHAGGKRPDLDPYCLIPGVKVSLHDVNAPAPTAQGMRWLLEKVVINMKAGRSDEAMKYLGVLCHWLEDPGSLSAHSSPVSEAVLRELVPPPNDLRNRNYLFGYGWINLEGSDRSMLAEADYAPRLLGRSIDEATLHLVQRQRLLRKQAAGDIIPALQARLKEDGKAFREVVGRALRRNAELIADVILTAISLSAEPDLLKMPVEHLDQIRLADWLPEEPVSPGLVSRPYYAVPFLVNASLDSERHLHPLALTDEPGKPAAVDSGFGVGVPVRLRFTLAPARAVSQFRARVGLHPTARNSGRVRFRVLFDNKEVAASPTLASGDPAIELTVPIPAVDAIVLTLESLPVEGAPGGAGSSNENLGVWGEPTLMARNR